MTTDACPPFPRVDRMRDPNAKGMYPWLALLGFPMWELVSDGVPGPAWAAVAGLIAVGVLYAVTIRRAFAVPRRPVVPAFAAFAALCTLLAAAYENAWYTLFILASIAAGAALRRSGPFVAAGLAAVAVAVELTRLPPGGAATGAVALAWGTFTAGLVRWITLRLFEAIAQLRRTREELALAAVERERLRFSRDLHDLLGHTLSVMVVKAELVRRVAPRDAEAAARQAADIERIGRQALAEVRAAVTGYRGRGLAAELDPARTALADAGITATIRTVALGLPPETDALLGWAVREGTTNVLRHSGAATCGITLEHEDGEVMLRVEDDGHGPAPEAAESPGARHGDGITGLKEQATAAESPGARRGHGLTGLQERVTAAGGHLTFGPRPGGGFRLRVQVPLTRTSRVDPDDPTESAAVDVARIAPRHGAELPDPELNGPVAHAGDGETTRHAPPRAAEIPDLDEPEPARIGDGPARGDVRAGGGRPAAVDRRGGA